MPRHQIPTDEDLALFLQGKRGEVKDLVRHLGAGTLDAERFALQMRQVLIRGHAYAGYLGRRRAGDLAPYEEDDTEFGRMVMADQQPFLDAFVADLETDRYEDEAGRLAVDPVERRAQLYVDRMLGSANEALVLATPASWDRWWWRLGAVATHHCQDCPEIAAGSPYSSRDIPTWPASGATTCGVLCRCTLEREDGVTSFVA